MSNVLLIIDMQRFIEDRIKNGINYYPYNAINNMEHVLKKFRANNWLVAHVIHQSEGEDSLLNPNSPHYQIISGIHDVTMSLLEADFARMTLSSEF